MVGGDRFARWQDIRAELDAELLKRIASLPERIQDWILPFNECCGNFLEAFIFRDSAPLAELQAGIDSITVQGLQRVFGTLYLAHTGLQRESSSVDAWHSAMTMAEAAYGMPEAKTDEWELFFVQHSDDSGKLMVRLHNEITPAFRIGGGSFAITMVWMPLLHAIAKATQHRRAARMNLRSRGIRTASKRRLYACVPSLWRK